MTTEKPELPVIPFANCYAWEAWLEEHHTTADGLWLKIAREGSGTETVSFAEALEGALCYGWIDSRTAKTTSIGCSGSPRADRGAGGRSATAAR